jgi:hypothetical protein
LKIRKSARAMVAAAVLAAGSLAAGGGMALAAPAQGRGVPPIANESCQKWARTHTFVWIRQAAGSARAGLAVTGKMVTVTCGYPDYMYVITGKPFTGHLLPPAKITVLADAVSGIDSPAMTQARFPRWVRHAHFGSIYAVTGPFKAIRELNEEYHP